MSSVIIENVFRSHMIGWASLRSPQGSSGLVCISNCNVLAMSHESNFIIKALAQKLWTFVASSTACQFCCMQRHQLDLNSNDSHLDRETSVAIDHSWLSCRQIQYATDKVKYLIYQELSEAFTHMLYLPHLQCLSWKQTASAHCWEAVTLHVEVSVVIMNVHYLPTFLKSRFVT